MPVTKTTSDLGAPKDSNVGRHKSAIKKEVETPAEQVFHRKSERRRVARDIFLVFEEQPSRRRGRGGSNKKQARPKSKFGHLKVEEPNKTKTKGLLRDIKNEPKCYLNGDCPATTDEKTTPRTKQTKAIATTNEPTPIIDNVVAPPPAPPPCDNPIARVNPIFLWVKQDDTRIVEVRCEDYDKRNRIRITKTTNGWRAIPRTDPSSSRIVKFFHTPLLKVKREVYDSQTSLEKQQKLHEVTATAASPSHALEPETNNEPEHNALENSRDDGDIQLGCCPSNLGEVLQEEFENQKERRKKNKKERTKDRITPNDIFSSCEATMANEKFELSDYVGDFEDGAEQHPTVDCDSGSQATTIAKSEFDKDHNINEIIETYQTQTPELRLCPKTGLFLPNSSVGVDIAVCSSAAITLPKAMLVDMVVDCDIERRQSTVDEIVDSLDAETKNLKDLLDDADLLQHCGDNVSSGAELIDSLVKRSCENNLIQETEMLKDSVELNTYAPPLLRDSMSQEDTVTEVLPQIIDSVSDPPKCLSFNEAGEIEGLNCELFQSNNFIDTFDKDPIEEIPLQHHPEPPDPADMQLNHHCSLEENKMTTDLLLDDAPKDLSYKKREEVCPPSESRSQCAVTSSSDVVKSPQKDENPAIESTSETIKNLILEQFVKLNALNAIPTAVGKPQQSEPIDLGKHREPETETDSNNYAATTNYIETVVIDDNSDDEPVRKRLRNTVQSSVVNLDEPPSIIDKDPDPLTQLQLLIRNTQWKVPDPILVPKDRLAAVLASPAREIPLLITTRPELRLPEAFAYPEIIQNPNILVISMAQLEAILKNEMETEKGKAPGAIDEFPVVDNTRKLNQKNVNEMHNEPKTLQPKEINAKCSHVESSLASDINAATLAVLNQMLWLPYFGQLSQEFFKSLKEPIGMQNKFSSLLPPLYNHQFGLQHLDELYKNYIKQITNLKHLNNAEPANHHQSSSPSPNYASAMGAFQNPVELAIFQKIVQHQMHNFLNMNPMSADANPQGETMANHSSNEHSSNLGHINSIDQKRTRKSLMENSPVSTFTLPPEHNSNSEPLADKSLCVKKLKSNCDNSLADNSMQKHVADSKPRLTCKSLSNLLEPESMTSAAVPLVNLTSDSIRHPLESTKPTDSKNLLSKEATTNCLTTPESTFRTVRTNKVVNPSLNAFELSKQRKRNINFVEAGTTDASLVRNTEAALNADTNPALWHPLFGSNAKPDYNSPWHWTTVTATGE